MNKKATLSSIALLTIGAQCCNASDFALHGGDRVVFYGDSITDNSPYTTFVETYVLTRFPELNVRYFNAGVGGDRVTGGWMGGVDQRLPRDLFSRRPTVVTVMLGMNDGSYRPFDQSIFDTYRTGFEHIVDEAKKKAPNARLFLIKPSPFDDVTRDPSFPGGYNGVLRRYGEFVGELAQKNGYGAIDLNTPVVDMLTSAKEKDPATAAKIIPDRVHPSAAGHLIMAEAILKSWNAPSLVSSTEIDAKTGANHAENASVSNVKTGPALTWTSRENSLPFPLDRGNAETKLVLASSDFDRALNQETLRITSLADGKYKLSIDGTKVGDFSSGDLAEGINLAQWSTPMNRQASDAFAITGDRTQTRYFIWRQLEFSLGHMPAKEMNPSMNAFAKAEDELIRLQHAAAKPVPHQFELIAE